MGSTPWNGSTRNGQRFELRLDAGALASTSPQDGACWGEGGAWDEPADQESPFRRSISEQIPSGRRSSAGTPGTPRPPRELQALDLSMLSGVPPTDSEESVGLKREKLRYYESQCNEVAPSLFMSSEAVAKSFDTLRRFGITHVVNCVGASCEDHYRERGIGYLSFHLKDSPQQDITGILLDTLDFIDGAIRHGGRVLVHCSQGVSRSAALCIAYLMHTKALSYGDAYSQVKSVRGVANPNIGFICQLVQWQNQAIERRLGTGVKLSAAVPPSPVSNIRSPRGIDRQPMFYVGPFSDSDRDYLVLKQARRRGSDFLDARGVFVLVDADVTFVWVGAAARQRDVAAHGPILKKLVRYDQIAPRIVQVRQGEETLEFKRSLGCAMNAEDLGTIGSNVSYDPDFT